MIPREATLEEIEADEERCSRALLRRLIRLHAEEVRREDERGDYENAFLRRVNFRSIEMWAACQP